MAFLFPGFLIAAGIAAAGVVALHLLGKREAEPRPFPTVRFVEDTRVRSAVLAPRFTDVPLLLLRVSTVLLVGAALAQPRWLLHDDAIAKIVVVDVSRAVNRDQAWRDRVRQQTADAAVIVIFDSVAHEIEESELAAALDTPSGRRGSLSAGLIASLRAAARIGERADSLELVLISPLLMEENDDATLPIRALWPGAMTIVRTQPVQRSPANRGPPARVEWAGTDSSTGWDELVRAETLGGIRAGDATLVFPFERRWRLDAPEGAVDVLARWIDGEPAAVERPASTEGACVRSMGFAMPQVGDAVLRPDFVRFLRSLSAPCGESAAGAPLPPDIVSRLEGGRALASSASIDPQVRRLTGLAPWLLLSAVALLALEYPLRTVAAKRRAAVRTDPHPDSRPPWDGTDRAAAAGRPTS